MGHVSYYCIHDHRDHGQTLFAGISFLLFQQVLQQLCLATNFQNTNTGTT
jgi:hypothetical protein